MVESQEEKIIRLTKLGETCRKIIEGEITLFPKLTEEDYEYSIGRFIKTKETIIQKRMIDSKNFHLDFNLDNNKKIIWDMLFLSEVISRQITDPNAIKEILTKMINVNLFGETYNNETLSQEENNKLKKSVVIYQKTRDSLSHNPNNITSKIDKEINKLIINNPYKNCLLQCEIPFQYIEKFGSGIIPTEEHKELAKEIDEITSNIFFKLGFEMKEIPNFIYKIHPSRLELLLKKVNGNINKLKELPREIFDTSFNEETIELIFKQSKADIDKIREFPYYVFLDFGDKKYKKRLKYILELANGDMYKLKNFQTIILTEECSDERLEFLLKKVNYDIEKLQYFPSEMYEERYCNEEKIEYFLKKVNNNIKELREVSIQLIKCDIEKIEYLLEKVNYNFTRLTKLPNILFYKQCTITIIEKIIKQVNNNLDGLKELPLYLFIDEDYEDNLEKILKEKGIKIEEYKKYIEYWRYDLNFENILYMLEKTNNVIEKLEEIPGIIFTENCSIERIEYLLKKVNGNINKLKELPQNFLLKEHTQERIEYLIEITKGNISELKLLPEIFYKEEFNKEKIEFLLKITNSDINKIINLLYRTSDDILKNNISEKRLEYLMTKSNNNIDLLRDLRLPQYIFIDKKCSEERIEYILSLVDYNFENLKNLPYILFDNSCNIERINKIINKLNDNIEKLKEIPTELFTCNDDIFEKLYNTHEMNMIKSIFGIGDEKLITLMVYMNAVFSNYQEEIENKPVDIRKLDIEIMPKKITDKSKSLEKKITESNIKKNSLKEITIKPEVKSTIGSTIGAIKTIPTEDKLQKDITEINNEFIRLIGNSSRHFRIYKQDENTIVLEDYTKDEQGNIKLAFRATSTIEELFNITSSLVSNNVTCNLTEEVAQKINISNKDKYTKEQLEIINQEYEKTKIELVKKILIQICLNKKGITSITETKENNITYFEYSQQNGIKIKRDLEELYQYFKNIESEIFNEAIEEYNNYLKEKNINELECIQNNNIKKKKLNKN